MSVFGKPQTVEAASNVCRLALLNCCIGMPSMYIGILYPYSFDNPQAIRNLHSDTDSMSSLQLALGISATLIPLTLATSSPPSSSTLTSAFGPSFFSGLFSWLFLLPLPQFLPQRLTAFALRSLDMFSLGC